MQFLEFGSNTHSLINSQPIILVFAVAAVELMNMTGCKITIDKTHQKYRQTVIESPVREIIPWKSSKQRDSAGTQGWAELP